MSTPTPERRKHSFLVTARSREQLIQETVHIQQQRQRRTKIIATLGDSTLNYEKLKEMVQAGATSFNMNTSYVRNKSALKELAKWRDQLEKEMDCFIPLNLVLKGRQIRIGNLRKSEIYLQTGNIIRLTQDNKVIGDKNIISIDDETFFDQVNIGEKVVIDYGQVVLQVEAKEESDVAYKLLMEQFPDNYPSSSSFRHKTEDDSDSDKGSRQGSRRNSIKSVRVLQDDQDEQVKEPKQDIIPTVQQKKQQIAEQLKKQKELKKLKKYKVLVCIVQVDCILKPLRPIFILSDSSWMDPHVKGFTKNKQSYQNLQAQYGQGRIIEQDEDESQDSNEDEESQITTNDIVYIQKAKNLGYDSITISNVHTGAQVRELKKILGDDSQMKIIVRITTKQGVENFQELCKECDGIVIARAYILVQSAIETVVYQQLDMIRKAHEHLKPVIISSQILESMITSLFPSFSEMGDIANLVNEDIDAITLTGETAYGQYPVQAIATLDRVCRFVEANQIQKRIERFAERAGLSMIASKKHVVANAISSATVDAAYRISAKLIIVFTSTGSTALKISKLKPPCQIIAVTSNLRVARLLQLVGGIINLRVPTLLGTEQLQQSVIQMALTKSLIKAKDYVIMLSGSIENIPGQINALKIMQIQ